MFFYESLLIKLESSHLDLTGESGIKCVYFVTNYENKRKKRSDHPFARWTRPKFLSVLRAYRLHFTGHSYAYSRSCICEMQLFWTRLLESSPPCFRMLWNNKGTHTSGCTDKTTNCFPFHALHTFTQETTNTTFVWILLLLQ